MLHPLLNRLTSPEFHQSVGMIQTPAPLRRHLKGLEDVRRVAIALRYGHITETMIGEFVSSLVKEYRCGHRLPGDLALAALAVVLEMRPTAFADKFLEELSGLRLVELNTGINVARECVKQRLAVPRHMARSFVYSAEGRSPVRFMVAKPRRAQTFQRAHRAAQYPQHSGAA